MATRRLTHSDLPAVSRTLGAAFYDDPVWSWVFPDASTRLHALSTMWGLCFSGSVEYGWNWMADDVASVSVWIPPGMPEMAEPWASQFEPLLVDLGGDRAPLIGEVFDRFEASHPRDVPHYYLSLVGTHPDRQGSGIGMRLLRENLAQMDRDGVPAYLESSNPANLGRYQSLGFVQVGSFELPDNGPELITMWREPGPAI